MSTGVSKAMSPTVWRFASVLALSWTLLGPTSAARGQLPTTEERLKILTDPESVKKKLEKERTRPPLELTLTQVAPFDVLPYAKANHWSTLTAELLANYDDFGGILQTSPVPLVGLPREMVYRRDARLTKTQRGRLGLQIFLPVVPSQIGLDLLGSDGGRPVESWPARLTTLEPHQMVVVVLARESSEAYASWGRLRSVFPESMDPLADELSRERQRYYRFVLPLKPERPPLSPHPLTWTTISHIVWDGLPPDGLNPSQQQAMLDWLHWGGQLVLIGGAGPKWSVLKDSFLAPYLPAEPTGGGQSLTGDDLGPLSRQYPPLARPSGPGLDDGPLAVDFQAQSAPGRRYLPPAPINPRADRPVYLSGLSPKEDDGVRTISLDEAGTRRLAVEWRIGRGRVTMLALDPTDPALVAWPGLDTLVRRVVLRRPEEGLANRSAWVDLGRFQPPRFGPLAGPDLSWVRYLTRDLGGPIERPVAPDPNDPFAQSATSGLDPTVPPIQRASGPEPGPSIPRLSVADWNDASALPQFCRKALETASGITVPSARFVLGVIAAYILALVPLNWLICRYLFNRRELAWVVVPLLSLGFAVGVERAAAYDLGYDTACDEIDVLEAYGGYPRALLTRFGSLYSSGRTRFSVSYPDEPSALVLPLDNGRSIRGEEVVRTDFQSYPVPALLDYLVQPRSLSFFRAEQFSTLDGAISLESDAAGRRVANGSGLTLRDAVLVDRGGGDQSDVQEVHLGTIGPGASVEVKAGAVAAGPITRPSGPDATELLALLRRSFDDRPEDQGELRLVAWVDQPAGGQTIVPAIDRHRGVMAVVVHLRSGPPPDPSGPIYQAPTGSAASDPAPRRPAR